MPVFLQAIVKHKRSDADRVQPFGNNRAVVLDRQVRIASPRTDNDRGIDRLFRGSRKYGKIRMMDVRSASVRNLLRRGVGPDVWHTFQPDLDRFPSGVSSRGELDSD